MPNCRVGPIRGWPFRLFDVICAAAGLVMLLPVLFVTAILILWNDGRPVLFSQKRIGKGGKPFRIWKFRTMRSGSLGTTITAAGDARITPIGAALRKHRLDELPQLFNVLRGDMSLVGPRPEVPEFVKLDAPIWQVVLQVPPGLTDLATLLFRDEENLLATSSDPLALYRETILPTKLILNVAYLRSRSFLRDLRLIYLTAQYSLAPKRFDRLLIRRAAGNGVMS